MQMRVLWELQNHFHSHLPRDGVAPYSLEAIALCVLSFPDVIMDVKKSSCSPDISRIAESKDHCVLDIDSSYECMFEIEDYRYDIRSACGPQDVFVSLSFAQHDEDKIQLSVRVLSGSNSGQCSFDWQLWRDSFYGRLEGARERQEKLSLPYLPLLVTTGSISCGIEKVQGRTAGTGSTMNVWKGWIPPRASICMYEITTSGFVMHSEIVGSINIVVEMSANVEETFTVARERWTCVSYERASPLPLKHASIVAQHLLKNVAEGTHGDGEELQDALVRAEKLMERNGDSDLALLLLERAALYKRDIVALEKAIDVMKGEEWTASSVIRGLRLLERFYISDSSSLEGSMWGADHLYRFVKMKLVLIH